jgi:ABC-2 type transport system ATP-binding protein
MTSVPVVRVDQLSKRFVVNKDNSLRSRVIGRNRSRRHREDFWALRDVDLEVELGSTVGLVGHNGSGKSTLLKAIGGILEPTSGSVQRRGRLAALLELGAGFHGDLSGRENVFLNAAILGLTRKETTGLFDAIVDFSGVEDFIDTQVKFYSSGMYVRLAFAIAVHSDPDLLLVDEVLAVGDEPYQRKCLTRIAEFQKEGRSIVLVSHAADQVMRLCDKVAVLESGRKVHEGAAVESFAVLRALYAEKGISPTAPLADKRCSIQLVTSSVAERGGVTSLSITIDVEIKEPLPQWGIELSIDTAKGLRLFTLDTRSTSYALPETVGIHQVTLSFAQVALGAGTYLVDVATTAADGSVVDRRPAGTSFSVSGGGVGTGIVRLDPQLEVDPRHPSV